MNCDCEPPQAYTERTRRARKAHVCCECGAEIVPGSLYQIVSGIWDGTPGEFKTCLSCVELRSFVQALPGACECIPLMGLLSTFDEYASEELLSDFVQSVKTEKQAELFGRICGLLMKGRIESSDRLDRANREAIARARARRSVDSLSL